jgi:hypothetical protein
VSQSIERPVKKLYIGIVPYNIREKINVKEVVEPRYFRSGHDKN